MVPDIEGVGDDGTVLAGKKDEDDDAGGAAEVLALGILILGAGMVLSVAGRANVALVAKVSFACTVED
jgi:hypothetical protein